eukprot:12735043-Prorocentrum_lima.AAC.1
MDVLVAQQESLKRVLFATRIIDHNGTPNVTDKSGDLFVAGVPDHLRMLEMLRSIGKHERRRHRSEQRASGEGN